MGTARTGWTTQRKLALASVACADVAGLVVLLETTLTTTPGPEPAWAWWTAYLLFLLTLLLVHGFVPRPRRLVTNPLLLVLIALAMALVALYPDQGWNALLFVATAATISFFWTVRTVVLVVIAQTAAVGLVIGAAGWPVVDVLMGVLAYGNFQAFGALVVLAARGEADARTELAVAHAELRSATALLEVTSREAERLRISRDLHDLSGHHLTVLSLELEVLAHRAEDPETRERLARAQGVARELLGSVRAAVGEMRDVPVALGAVLRTMAQDVPNLAVSVRVRGEERIRTESAVVIVRCVQEAITNCLRHSDAAALDVLVAADDGGIRVTVADDGSGDTGFEPGHGLTGMVERFESAGGRVVVRSGSGFTIDGWLPVPGREQGVL